MNTNPKSHSDATSMTVQQLSRLLTVASKQVISIEMITNDLGQGAPVNGDGTVNLVHYGAWLATQVR